MTHMVRFRCPGCGGELETPEGTISNCCSYCSLVSLLGRPGRIVKQYYPPQIDAREARFIAERYLKKDGRPLFSTLTSRTLYYVPFYRFRGLSLTCLSSIQTVLAESGASPTLTAQTYHLRARNVDFTISAIENNPFGISSLGVRPQAMASYAYSDEELPADAEILAPEMEPADSQALAFKMNSANLTIHSAERQTVFTEMIGERQSLLYFPLYVLTGMSHGQHLTLVVDALSKRVIHNTSEPWQTQSAGRPIKAVSALKPEPHKCPNCGSDFEPSERSLVYPCDNCNRAYLLDESGYTQMQKPRFFDGPGTMYPFWRVPLSFGKPRKANTVGEFTKLLTADIPLLARNKKEQPFYVYVPAFAGADAEWHVQAAVRMMRTQPRLKSGKQDFKNAPQVSLPLAESLEFAAFAWNWLRMSYGHLRGDDMSYDSARTGDAELVWMPMTDARLERSVDRLLVSRRKRELQM